MSPRLLHPFVLGLGLAALAGCRTAAPYRDEPEAPAAAAPTDAVLSAYLRIDSKPVGAAITVNGSQQGAAPVTIRVELDRAGGLLTPLEIVADYSINNPIRGMAHVVPAQFRRGDTPPRELLLARPMDGGVQRFGTLIPGR
jgi:hypothetical protein